MRALRYNTASGACIVAILCAAHAGALGSVTEDPDGLSCRETREALVTCEASCQFDAPFSKREVESGAGSLARPRDSSPKSA